MRFEQTDRSDGRAFAAVSAVAHRGLAEPCRHLIESGLPVLLGELDFVQLHGASPPCAVELRLFDLLFEGSLARDADGKLRVVTKYGTLAFAARFDEPTQAFALDGTVRLEEHDPPSALPLEFVDAKVRDFCVALLAVLDRSVVRSHWMRELHGAFAPTWAFVADEEHAAGPLGFARVDAHWRELCTHTLFGGKGFRAMLVRLVVTQASAGAPAPADPELLRQVHALGWACEAIQALALVADDIIDGSVERRGKPCWHVRVGVGRAINDALMLFSAVQSLLARERAFVEAGIVALVNRVLLKTCFGQLMDLQSSEAPPSDEWYAAMVEHKTSWYTFYLPVAMGLLLVAHWRGESAADGARAAEAARASMLEVGAYFQEQDDYLDVYGGAASGKSGTDIAEKKATWLVLHCLEHAPPAERAALRREYDPSTPKVDEARVRAIFDQCGLARELQRRAEAHERSCLEGAPRALRALVVVILAQLKRRRK